MFFSRNSAYKTSVNTCLLSLSWLSVLLKNVAYVAKQPPTTHIAGNKDDEALSNKYITTFTDDKPKLTDRLISS